MNENAETYLRKMRASSIDVPCASCGAAIGCDPACPGVMGGGTARGFGSPRAALARQINRILDQHFQVVEALAALKLRKQMQAQ